MMLIRNRKVTNRRCLIFLTNIVSLTFLAWINLRDNGVSEPNKYLNIKYNKDNTWKLRNDRLLTNDVPLSEIGQRESTHNLTLPGEKNKLKYITWFSEINEKLKKNKSNIIYTYIKKLEHGFTNKKGLKRLDCLYEKKLFDEMYKLDNITGYMKSKISYFKKVIWKIHGFRFILFSLVILFGIGMSLLCYFGCISGNSTDDDENSINTYILGLNGALYIPLSIALLSFIIYILSKVRIYKSLKRKYDKISLM